MLFLIVSYLIIPLSLFLLLQLLLLPCRITKVSHALQLLLQLRPQIQRFVDGALELFVLKMWWEGHVLEGKHEQIASLVAHSHGAATVRETARKKRNIIKVN